MTRKYRRRGKEAPERINLRKVKPSEEGMEEIREDEEIRKRRTPYNQIKGTVS